MATFLQCLLCSLILVAVSSVDGCSINIPRGYIEFNVTFENLIGKTVDEAKKKILLKIPIVKFWVEEQDTLIHTNVTGTHTVLIKANKNNVTEAPSYFGTAPDIVSLGKLVGMPYKKAVQKILKKIPGVEIFVEDNKGERIDYSQGSNGDPAHILITVKNSNQTLVAKNPVYLRKIGM